MTTATPVTTRVAIGEKATNNTATAKQQQSDVAIAAAAPANAIDGAEAPPTVRPLRRLKEGDAFILDINAGDRQCLMHARASRLVTFSLWFLSWERASRRPIFFSTSSSPKFSLSLSLSSTIRVGHASVPMRPLLGAPFGACFELDAKSKGLVRCDPAKSALEDEDDGDEDGADSDEEGGAKAKGNGDKGLPPPPSSSSAPDHEELANEVRTNASLQDAGGAAQSLKHDEIDALRASGARGSEIVAALVAGSSTFASKTALSQQKWVKRKVRKHVVRVSIRRPSAAALAAHAARGRGGTSSNGGSSSHTGGNAAIGCLRPEGVALLLNLGGVGPRAKVLVVDGVGGLLAAAVAERLGGHGLAVVAFGGGGGGGGSGGGGNERGKSSSIKRGRSNGIAPSSSSSNSAFCSPPQLESLRHVDISQAARDAVVTAPLSSLLEAAAEAREKGKRVSGEEKEEGAMEHEKEQETANEKKNLPLASFELKDPAGAERAAARKAAHARRQALARAAAARGFDAFVYAAPSLNPRTVLMAVAPLLAPSASFAMHVAWLQPAAELAAAAMEGKRAKGSPSEDGNGGGGHGSGGGEHGGGYGGSDGGGEAAASENPFAAAAVHLVEPWIRRYQVLPRRTHPEMWASGTGGYLVHGVSLPEGGASSCGGERAAAEAAAAGKAATAEANGADTAVSASADKAKRKKGAAAAVASDEYDPELSD